MVEVIHEREVSGNNSMGFLIGIILLIAVLLMFFYYGSALFRQSAPATPSGAGIQVPEQIDVNVNQQPQ
jgi:hypothetical protein